MAKKVRKWISILGYVALIAGVVCLIYAAMSRGQADVVYNLFSPDCRIMNHVIDGGQIAVFLDATTATECTIVFSALIGDE